MLFEGRKFIGRKPPLATLWLPFATDSRPFGSHITLYTTNQKKSYSPDRDDSLGAPLAAEVELLQLGGLLERSAVEAAARDPPT
jgi:hypothetical protein